MPDSPNPKLAETPIARYLAPEPKLKPRASLQPHSEGENCQAASSDEASDCRSLCRFRDLGLASKDWAYGFGFS